MINIWKNLYNLLKYTFTVFLISYIIFVILDLLFDRFVSTFFNLNIILAILVVVAGIILLSRKYIYEEGS